MTTLTRGDQKALARVFFIRWAVLVLRYDAGVRAEFARQGLVERRGKLRLTPRGERVIALAKEDA